MASGSADPSGALERSRGPLGGRPVSPVDGGGAPVARQQARVVDDGAMPGGADDLHGDELAAEGQNVQLGSQGPVVRHHVGQGPTLGPPAGELEHRHAILLSLQACGTAGESPPPASEPLPACGVGGLLHPSLGLSLPTALPPSQALQGSMERWPQPGPASGMPLPGLTLPTARTSERLHLPDACVAPDLFTYRPHEWVSPPPGSDAWSPCLRFEDAAPPHRICPAAPLPLRARCPGPSPQPAPVSAPQQVWGQV